MSIHKINTRKRRHKRIRGSLSGTSERPRLCVYISNHHIYAQIIDDLEGKTLVSMSTVMKDLRGLKPNLKSATEVGKRIAELAKQNNITQVVLDRAGYRYHGRVKALAEAARQVGLKF